MHPVAAGPAAVEAGRQRGGEALAVQGGGAEVPDPDQVPATGVLGRAGLGHQKQSRPGGKGPSGRSPRDGKSDVEGTGGAYRVEPGGRRTIKNNNTYPRH